MCVPILLSARLNPKTLLYHHESFTSRSNQNWIQIRITTKGTQTILNPTNLPHRLTEACLAHEVPIFVEVLPAKHFHRSASLYFAAVP